MAKFIADKSFWDLFPQAEIGVITAKGLKNDEKSNREIRDMLYDANDKAYDYLTEPVFSNNKVIKVWRDAFKLFKTKKGARCSIEALLKRVSKGNPVGSINPLVDIYNCASLLYALPCGAEDMDKFVGDLKLTITEGNDSFFAIGEDHDSPTLEGELCYKDDEGAVCRCFNWRDAQRTMIDDSTENAILFIESVDPSRSEDLRSAMEFIKENFEKYLEAKVEITYLNIDNQSLTMN